MPSKKKAKKSVLHTWNRTSDEAIIKATEFVINKLRKTSYDREDIASAAAIAVVEVNESFDSKKSNNRLGYLYHYGLFQACKLLRNSNIEKSNKDIAMEIVPSKTIQQVENNESLSVAIDKLDDRSKLIVLLYYYHDSTLEEIGSIVGLSKERVRQVMVAALRKLKKHVLL